MVGDKYFNSTEIVRILDENPKRVLVRNDITKRQYTMKKEELINRFNKLKPNGKLHTYAIKSPHRNHNYDIVARFYHGGKIKKSFIYKMGCVDSFDDGFRFITDITNPVAISREYIGGCRPIAGTEIEMSWYIDDNIKSLLRLIPVNLQKFYATVSHSYKQDIKKVAKAILNAIDNIYKILPLNLEVVKKFDDGVVILNRKCIETLEHLLGHYVSKVFCVRYWYDIDKDSIPNDKVLIRDIKNKNLYLFKYIKGEVIMNPLSNAMSMNEMAQFLR